jgi:hypothetical protein
MFTFYGYFSRHVQRNLLKSLQLLRYQMKNFIRALVVVLALTGVAATTQTSSASAQNKVTIARVSLLPVPVCAPDDPNACGMARGRH